MKGGVLEQAQNSSHLLQIKYICYLEIQQILVEFIFFS